MNINLFDIICREYEETEGAKINVQDRSLRTRFNNSDKEESINGTSTEVSSRPSNITKI